MIILLNVHIILPVRDCSIQQRHSKREEWITEESKANDESHYLNDRMT